MVRIRLERYKSPASGVVWPIDAPSPRRPSGDRVGDLSA
jgi:hypothetical protein